MKNSFLANLAIVAAVLTASSVSVAHGHETAQTQTQTQPEASEKLNRSMQTMNKDMKTMAPKGDADSEFASMMIRHHQAAIEMARVELQYGNDPKIRQMAQTIIKDQQKEIKELQSWQSKQSEKGGQQQE